MVLADYTESDLRRNSSYVHGSLSKSTSGNIVTVTYEEKGNTGKNALIGTGAGAGAAAGTGAAIGFAFGGPVGALAGGAIGFFGGSAVGGGIGFAIPQYETVTYYFDANSGEYLGSTKSEAVTNALSKGVSKFESQNFRNARDLFQAAYYHSPSGSSEERTGQNNRNVTDLLMEGMSLINGGNYATGVEKVRKAYNDSTDSRMDAVIRVKRNELAEKINSVALNQFQAGNWAKAQELFNHAYLLCASDYQNEREFKNRETIAAKINSINASNEVAVLTDALSSTTNSSMRSVIQNRLESAKRNAAQRAVISLLNEGVNLINNGSYITGREKILSAYNQASSSEIKSQVSSKRNEMAEKINLLALNEFQSGNWTKAEELSNHAYLLCTDGYKNENEFKNRRAVAAKMKSISSTNEISDLTDALNAASNSSMKNVIQTRIDNAKKAAAERIVINLMNEGINLISNGNYASGRGKILDAYNQASSSEIKSQVSSKRNEMAEKINSLAMNQFLSGNWTTAEDLFNHAYLLCTDGYQNENEFKNRRNIATKMKSANDYTDLADALNAASNSSMRSVIQTRLESAKNVAAQKFFNDAMANWNQAWTAESDETQDRSDEAAKKFSKSQELFSKSAELVPVNNDYIKWTAVSSLKIEGNDNFNEGLKLQKKGDELKSQSKFGEAKAKYLQAQGNFENGLRKSGDQRFQASIDFVKEQIEEVEEAIHRMGVDFGSINVYRPKVKPTDESEHNKDVDTTVHT